MFYSQFILAKKGPLGTIWIAAHLERKLRKNQVAETNIGVSVDSILFPEVPIALRLSGHLLLGVVRIYSKKVNYLFHDCSEALVKIKQAFHSTIVDLPPEAATAPFHSITLPETFDFDELELLQDPECSFVQSNGNFVDHNVTTREQITLQDPMEDIVYPGSSQFGLDERFVDGDSSPIGLDFDEDIFSGKLGSPVVRPSSPAVKEDIPPCTSGHDDQAVQMEMNDHHEPSTPVFDIDRTERDEPGGTSGLEQIKADQQQNLFLHSFPSNHLEESDMARASSNDPDVFLSGNPTPSFNALLPQTQQVFEARTPDLNKEFCPPDEPSPPALPEETSSPFQQETSLISGPQERLFPSSSGGVERARPDEHIYMLTGQASVVLPLGQSRQDVVVPAQPTLQHFPPLCGSDQSSAAMDLQQASMAPQQLLNNSLIPQSATPSFPDQSFRLNPAQQPSNEFNRNASATAFQGFQHPASMQQLPAGLICHSGQDLASPALFSSPMIDQHLSPFAGSEQSREALHPQQVSMPSQAQLSSILTSQNASSSVFNPSLRLNAVEEVSSVEANRDASFAPFQGFPVSPSMQQLAAGSYHQPRGDLCVPAQFSSSVTEQHFTPFAGLQQSNAAVYPQQANVLSQPHFHSMSINQKTPSFTDQSSVSNLAHKPSFVEANRDTNATPFQGFPLPASLRQLMTGSYQNISLGTSNYLAPLAATNANHSMASLHQPFGKPSAALNHPWSSSMPNHEASLVFQQPGLLANPKTMLPMLIANTSTNVNHALASSIGTAESSSVFQQHGTIWDNQISMTDPIRKTFQSIPIASNLHSSVTSSGSFSPPAQESSTLAQTDSTVLNTEIPKSPINQEFLALQRSQEVAFAKENILSAAGQQQMALRGTHEVAVTKESVSPAATQHFVTSPEASLAFNLPSGSGIKKVQGQVTIHGIQEPAAIKDPPPSIELHHVGSPASSLPSSLPSVLEREEGQRKTALHMSDIPLCETLRSTAEALREEPEFFSVRNNLTIPALELERSNADAAKTNEKLKEVTHPTLDKTPSLREETPITATKRSAFSMRSFDSVPGDDDVLATILGRGTSAFKVLSTPKENPVAKRQRVVLRSSFKKRKIEFDTLTVLHGDMIRQQLANTEDIRRVRKKAPCTRREIWSLNREIQGQQLFCEPSLPGLSTSLHDLYRAVLGVNGAKLSSSDLLKTSQDLLAVESENSRLVIEDTIGDSGRLVFEGRKESNSSEIPSEAIRPPEKILLEESVAYMRRDDELTAGVLKESLNKTLPREDLCAPLQHSKEAEEQVGRVQERISVCEAELVNNLALDIEAREKGLQNGSQGLEDIYLQGSIFREREEHMDAVEQKGAVHGVIENDVVQGLVDSVMCNLMDVGREGNSLGVETNREIELITSQGDIGTETQGLATHSGQEVQGPRTDAQCAQIFRSFGTDVHGRQADLQSLQTIPGAKEDALSRQVDVQSLQALPNENQYVLSRQIDLQYLQATSNETQDVLNGQVNVQSLQATPNEKQDVLSREVGLPIFQAAPNIFQAAPNEMQDVLNRQVNLQSLQATPNEKQDVLSREVDMPILQAAPNILQGAPNEMQDVLNRQVNLQYLQATPNEKQDILSREVDLQILQAAPNEMQGVLNRQVNLQPLQAPPVEKQDVFSREVDLLTLQTAPNTLQAVPNEKQDVLIREAGLQCLQTPPSVKQDVVSREVNLQSLQATPGVFNRDIDLQSLQATPGVVNRDVDFQSLQTTLGAKQDVLSMQVYLQALQTTQGAKQDVLCGQGNLQSLQTTPGAEQDVVEIPSLSNAAIDDGKEKTGDILEKNMDASKENQEFAFISDAKVTEFLAADNDMAYNEVDDFAECASEELDSSIHDNNGWSARTRNVGRYLKTVFEGMEVNSKRSGEQGNPKLGLGRLLTGKTRKEAARMFFETLVLKTREYINVEQQNAFEDIQLYPSPKLLKTSF